MQEPTQAASIHTRTGDGCNAGARCATIFTRKWATPARPQKQETASKKNSTKADTQARKRNRGSTHILRFLFVAGAHCTRRLCNVEAWSNTRLLTKTAAPAAFRRDFSLIMANSCGVVCPSFRKYEIIRMERE